MRANKLKTKDYNKRLKYSIGEELLKSNDPSQLKAAHTLKDIPTKRDEIVVRKFIEDLSSDIKSGYTYVRENPMDVTASAAYALSVFYPRKAFNAIKDRFI